MYLVLHYVRVCDTVTEETSLDTQHSGLGSDARAHGAIPPTHSRHITLSSHHSTSQPETPRASWRADGPDRTKWQLTFDVSCHLWILDLWILLFVS